MPVGVEIPGEVVQQQQGEPHPDQVERPVLGAGRESKGGGDRRKTGAQGVEMGSGAGGGIGRKIMINTNEIILYSKKKIFCNEAKKNQNV